MKRYAFLTAIMASAVLAVSCKGGKSIYIPEVTGAPYEVLVVIDDKQWAGPVGDTLTSVLTAQVPVLNQREPLTDVYQIAPSKLKGLLMRYGNIIKVSIDPSFELPGITIEKDVSARGQQIINVTGPDVKTVAELISWNREEIIQVIYMSERDRYVRKMALSPAKDVMQAVKDNFGFDMTIPSSYKIRSRTDDFMWISFELRLASLGMAIYSYPYTNRNDFTLDSIISKRNEFVARIPAEKDGTYMTTANYDHVISYIRIDGRLWAYTSGMWNVKGDFLGGPFRSYTTLDEATDQMICVDFYVMAPNENKRNYVKQLESMIHTVRFPGDNSVVSGGGTE